MYFSNFLSSVYRVYYSFLMGCVLLLFVSFCYAEDKVDSSEGEGRHEKALKIHFRSPALGEVRFRYEIELIRLALEKSKDRYGEYELSEQFGMTSPRTITTARLNTLENFFFKTSYSSDYIDDLAYVPIPLERGLVGYRVCFTSRQTKKKLAKIVSAEDLKGLTFGQGKGWLDAEILRYNGFKVVEVADHRNLYSMVAKGRIDLFCRGANEIMREWELKKNIEGLEYDERFSLHYDLPRFYWTNKKNVHALERVIYGVRKSYEDGSMIALWKKYIFSHLKDAGMKDRKVFTIKNPKLEGLSDDYKKYFYDPSR